jgi:hypothetical protein
MNQTIEDISKGLPPAEVAKMKEPMVGTISEDGKTISVPSKPPAKGKLVFKKG